MNSRLDWLVLSDYYSIYVTNAAKGKKYEPLRFLFLAFFRLYRDSNGLAGGLQRWLILYGKTSRPNNRLNGCLQPRRDSERTEARMSEN